MTRIPSFAAWTVLACATAFAASRSETTTYVDGNLAGFSTNTGGTLVFSDDTLVFRTGLATVNVPYASITKSDLGATRETTHGKPLYKVWARRKKTETQFLVVEFKNEEGEAKTMTLELAQESAPSVLATIQEHKSGTAEVAQTAAPAPVQHEKATHENAMKPAPAPAAVAKNTTDAGEKASPATKAGSDWWGDNIWKTTTNAGTWAKPAGASAPEE